jgi:hypothetical protein
LPRACPEPAEGAGIPARREPYESVNRDDLR